MKKLWGGRFTKPTAQLVEEYTASINFDQKMAKQDILGSLAHVTMLGSTGIISETESKQIIEGLKQVYKKLENNSLDFKLSDEDIHMNIERNLYEEIGAVAGKLHTARSRNDQVTTDLHLYTREALLELSQSLLGLLEALQIQANANQETIFPGYTHLQRAQPVLFSHHLLAYFGMFSRDLNRIQDLWKRVNICPLGACALAGTTFQTDRKLTTKLLKFDDLYTNSMDAVSDRDYVIEFLSVSSLIIMHLSRFSEELILWCSNEFNFVELDDSYTTGSSIMPQKKNPDVAELVRGKTGRVYGGLISLLTILKGLPLTYNKDLQEDKEALFDTYYTVNTALKLYAGMVATMQVKKDVMFESTKKDFSNATDLADYLAKKGIPFREAHEITGKTVLYAIEQGKYLLDLKLEEFKIFSALVEQDIFDVIDIKTVVDKRTSEGGTSFASVKSQLELSLIKITDFENWISSTLKSVELRIEDF